MNHQKLECYQRLLQVVKDVQAVMPAWPRGETEVKDQLKRALTSAVLNLVEGNGRKTAKDRKCFFNRATASLSEASACLELNAIVAPKAQNWTTQQRKALSIAYAQIRRLP